MLHHWQMPTGEDITQRAGESDGEAERGGGGYGFVDGDVAPSHEWHGDKRAASAHK